MNQEEAFVKAFIVPSKRERYLTLLKHPKRRRVILRRLSHMLDFVGDLASAVDPNKHTPRDVEELLKKRGANPTCYLISGWSDLDGREMPLGEALDQVVQQGDSIVCCLPGELAYYEPEAPGTAYILQK